MQKSPVFVILKKIRNILLKKELLLYKSLWYEVKSEKKSPFQGVKKLDLVKSR